MAERKATVGKHTAAEIAAGVVSPHDFVQVVDADQNPSGPLLFNPVGGGTPISIDPEAARAESTGLAETIAGVEARLAELAAQTTAKHGTIHHGAVAAYNVAPADADYELHLEEAVAPGPPPTVQAPGAVHLDGNVLTSDAFVLRVVNTTELAGTVTWANFSGVFVRDAGGTVNDITAQSPYVVDGDSSLLITLTNNGGALFLNLFPATAGLGAGALGGLQAAVASLAAQVAAIAIPADAGLRAAVASLVARIEAGAAPLTGGIVASLASVRAALDAHDGAIAGAQSERTGIAETIAGIEARLTVVEDDDDVVGAPDAVAIASLAARIEAIDIPPTDPLHVALASLVARLEALAIPVDGSTASSIASLRAALDAIDIPTTTPAEAGLASARAALDGHDRDLMLGASERTGLAEAIAGLDSASDVGIDERDNLAETVAGIEGDLDGRRAFSEVNPAAHTPAAATTVFADIPGAAITLAPGAYRVTFQGSCNLQSASVGSALSMQAQIIEAGGIIGEAATIGGNNNTQVATFPFTIVRRVILGVTTEIKAQVARTFAAAPTVASLNADTSLMAERVG